MNDFLLLHAMRRIITATHDNSFYLKSHKLRTLLVAFWLILPTLSFGQRADPDSLSYDSLHAFRPTYIIAPAALIVAGSLGIESSLSHGVNADIQTWIKDVRGNHFFHADDYLQYLPAATYVGLGLTGVKAKHSLLERTSTLLTAWVAMGIMVNATKYIVHEKRPDSNAHNSFPSGHTATAFMGAELIRKEYGNVWGAAAYIVAAGIGFLRIYNDRHWLGDVLAGAGLGILSAHIAYWLLPLERKLFGWNKHKRKTSGVSCFPSCQPNNKAAMLTLSLNF